MNDRIRQLQKDCNEWHAEASALLSKEAPTGEEQEKGLALVQKIKAAKNEIDLAFKGAQGLAELQALKDDPSTPFQFSGKAPGADGYFLGMKDAGKTVVDSLGTVLEDVGEGVVGSAERFKTIGSREYKRAFTKFLRAKGSTRGLHPTELKTVQEGLDSQGGAWVPADMLQRIVARTPTPTRVAGMVTNITTGSDRVVIPRTTYSADDLYATAFRATFTGELPVSDTQAEVDDTSLTGNVEIPVFTAMLTAAATNDMLEDLGFNFMGWLEQQLRVTVDLLRDNMCLNGTGRGQPLGMAVNPGGPGQPALLQTATAAKVSADDLVNGTMVIPEQYEEGITWVFNKTNTANGLRKIKDSNGRYMFGYGFQDSGLSNGRPKELAGYPFAYSGFMGNLGTAAQVAAGNSDGTVGGTSGNNFAVVGDLQGYWLVNRLGVTVQVLRETAAKRNQVEIVCRVRFGGKPVEPWRLRVLQVK